MLNRRHSIGHRCVLLAALFMIIFLHTAVSAFANQNTLKYSWASNVGPLNPHLYSPNQMVAQAMVYEPLVRYMGKGQIAPWLAESWDISADQLTYTFHLRKNVVFSDGTPFDARAVKLNFDAIFANADRHAWLGLISLIRDTQVIDDYTIAVVLKEPYYAILQDLTLVRPFRFLSPNAFPAGGNTANGLTSAIGTGPWKLVESRLGEHDFFERNEKY